NVISLYNQEYITIEGLEITNLDAKYNTDFGLNKSDNKEKILRAVNVSARDYGVVHNVILKDLYIHDINGNLNSKWNGGIFFDVKATKDGDQIKGIPTKYDNVLIENCEFENVDRSAIKLVSSDWSNQSLTNNPNMPLNWYPSTNVVVRNNKISKVGGDGITVRDTDHALIEYNVVGDARYQNTGYNAGIWPFQASNTVVQYNEVYRTHGVQDGQGLDCDHLSSYTVMQYNYSHDNEGGFMLVMNGFPHTAPTIRYNISQNDKDKTIEFSRGTPAGTMFYNNTIYSDSLLSGRGGIIDLPNTKAGTGNRDVYFFNNLFYYPEGQSMYVMKSDAPKNLDKFHFYNNAYFGGIAVPAEEEYAIVENPYLRAVGTGPTDNLTGIANTGKNLFGQLDGYLPTENSSLIGKGINLVEAIKYFSGNHLTDDEIFVGDSFKHTLSPIELFELSKNIDSIQCAATTYPQIDGVIYTTDFFGTPVPTDGSITIGAAEFIKNSSKHEE
ncbi:MAG: right-handed parallel beta-helix repeat-containing protein, partial [Turicibacter sp.]